MMGPDLTIAFDGLIVVLLLITIAYAVALNRKLTALRGAKADLERLLRSLSDSTGKAESGVEALRTHASQTGETLQRRIGEARALADDLAFLMEKGAPLADRLGEGLAPRSMGRQGQPTAGEAGPRAKSPAAPAVKKPAPKEAPAVGRPVRAAQSPDQEMPFPMTAVAAAKRAVRNGGDDRNALRDALRALR